LSGKIVLDLETDGLWPNYTTIWVGTVWDLDTGEYKSYTNMEELHSVLKREISKGSNFIGHNLLGYDWWVVSDLLDFALPLDQCHDTLCISRIDNSNRDGGHSLDAWGQRLGVQKPEHEDWSQLSDAMVHRNVEDCRINAKLYKLLINSINEKQIPWSEVYLEEWVHWKMTQVQRHGFWFDIEKCSILRSELSDKRQACEDELRDLFPSLPEAKFVKGELETYKPKARKDGSLGERGLRGCPVEWFEPGAEFTWVDYPKPEYTRDVFIRRHLLKAGWQPKVFTPTGQPKLSDELLDDIIHQVGDQYKPYQEWRILNTRITKQIDKWLEFYNHDTHRQHGSIIHIGTRTHRMAHRDPPITQVPSSDAPYGAECRDCWSVPEGKALLGCDASGIQLRVLAHYTGDREWISKLTAPGSDIHQTHADEGTVLLSKEVKRSQIKTITYSFLLGAGIPKLAAQAQCSLGEAEELRDLLYVLIPGLSDLMKEGKQQARKGYVTSRITHRRMPCQSDWHGDWLASYLQEGEASIMKRALRIWTRRADKEELNYTLVTVNHDEWQTEVDSLATANKLGPIQTLALQQAGRYYKCGCPIDGEWRVGSSWKFTH